MDQHEKEIKILLVKSPFIYYLHGCKEFSILSRICRTLLILLLFLFTFQNAFAQVDVKKNTAEEYRLHGYDEQQKGNLEEALAYYQKAVTLVSEPMSAPIYNDMGVIYEQMGLFSQAQESYLRAIQLSSRYLPTYSNLAYFYEGQGDMDRAIECLEKRVEWGKADDVWTLRAREELVRLSEGWPQVRSWLVSIEAQELSQELVKKGRRPNFHNYSTVLPEEKKQAQEKARMRSSQITTTLDQVESGVKTKESREQSVDAALETFESKEKVSRN